MAYLTPDDYLSRTKYCDFDHPAIRQTAAAIAASTDPPEEIATRCFYWVRDHILYRVGLWNMPASETLAIGEGTCTNSANLLVALLRFFDIPAGYGVMKVYGREYFGPVLLPMMKNYIGKESTHVYTTIFLDNRWLRVDSSDDYYFCKNTHYFNPTGQLIEFDGKTDAMQHIASEHVLRDEFPVADITPIIGKTPKNGRGLRIHIANTYICFLRSNQKRVRTHKDLQPLFLRYLIRNKPSYFLPFVGLLLFSSLNPVKSQTELPKRDPAAKRNTPSDQKPTPV